MPQRYTLSNGLTVILQESHASQVVAFQAWVRVGSADESPDQGGMAHVFEHMLFKGTARRGVGQIAQEVESAGGEINAWTSFDETVFHLVMASRYFANGLDIIADALQHPALDARELDRERRVILEEIKQGEDDPTRVATQALFKTAFHQHPYRRPVIGSARGVQQMTRERLVEFYQRYYVPNNTTLVVVGDFDPAQARSRIEKAFGAWPKRPLRRPPRHESGQRAPRVTVLPRDVQEAQLALAFHVPGMRHADASALDVLGVILGQGDSSRLNLEVRRNRQLATEVYSYAYTPRDHGLLVVGASLPQGAVVDGTQAILDEVFRLAHDEASLTEVLKARTIIESEAVYQRETVQGLARKLGFFEAVAGDAGYEASYTQQVRHVSPQQVREVARRYLTPENLSLAVIVPASELGQGRQRGERLRRRLVAMARTRAATVERRFGAAGAAGAAVDGTVTMERLPSGLRLIIHRDSSVPVVAFRAVWPGGTRYEDERTNGISHLLAALVTRGTTSRSGEEIVREVEGMAGAIGGFSGRNSFGVRAETLARHWDRGLEILADCIRNPELSAEELEKERRQVLAELRAQEDNLPRVVFRLFTKTFYKKHPYRLDPMGTHESVSGLTRRRLLEFFRRHYSTDRMTLAVVGDVDPERVTARVRALFAGRGGGNPHPPPEVAVEPKRGTGGPEQAFKFADRQQAHVVVGFPGTTVRHRDRFALEVLATVLSGQGGRLFVELRDRRALAYRVSAFSLEGTDPGYFAIFLATSPENLGTAVGVIQEEVRKLTTRPVTRRELERAQRYLVGAQEISLQRRAALASSLAFHEAYGMGYAAYRRYAPGILAVTVADLERVARRYLDWRRAVIAVVKPEEATPAVEERKRLSRRSRQPRAPLGGDRARSWSWSPEPLHPGID